MKLDIQRIFIVAEVFYIMNIIERDIVMMLFLFSYLFKLFIHCVGTFSLLVCISSIILEGCSRSCASLSQQENLIVTDDMQIPLVARIGYREIASYLIEQTAFIPHATALVSHDSRRYRNIRYLD